MKIYLACYNPFIHESAFCTLSIHRTKKGAETAIKEHEAEMLRETEELWNDEEDKEYANKNVELSMSWQKWKVVEDTLLD